jgi:hypothetical protein
MKHLTITFKDKLRYDTLDDYGVDVGTNRLWFDIRDTGVEGYNIILLIHALVEYILTQSRGIPVTLIDSFDERHTDSEEPGDEVNSPYRNEHNMAVGIERILCAYMNIPWKVYEEALIKSLGDDQ